jgi:probable rRNA maturation factor
VRLLLGRHKGCAKKRIPWLDRSAVERLKRAAALLRPADADVEFVIADDAYVRELNRAYRGIDRPTDVISFSYKDEAKDVTPGEGAAGEIYVSYETVEAQAREQGVAPGRLFLRIGVHGLLHVAGHVHGTRSQADRMEAEERRILSEFLTPTEVEELF